MAKKKYNEVKNKRGFANIALSGKRTQDKIVKKGRKGYSLETVKTPYKNKKGTPLWAIFWRKE